MLFISTVIHAHTDIVNITNNIAIVSTGRLNREILGKMLNTPEKSVLNISSFSPVRRKCKYFSVLPRISSISLQITSPVFQFAAIESPSNVKSTKGDAIGIRQRLKAIAKTLVDNHKKWDAAHLRGVVLCKTTQRCKSNAIRQFNDTNISSTDRSLYPAELKPTCDKLNVITTIFEDVYNSAIDATIQTNSYIQLGASNVFAENRLLFRTWSCDRFHDAVKRIADAYKHEYQVKLRVMENIAHGKNDGQLVLHVAAWELQSYVNDDLRMTFEALINEAAIELDEKA